MIAAAIHLAAVALICLVAGPTPPAVFLASLLLGLLPDIDTPKSLLGQLLRPLSSAIETRYGHRTITHSLLALALVAGASYLLARPYWATLAGAYASHLLIDLLIGASGIALCWPARLWLTIAAWREDGLAPRAILITLLSAVVVVTLWPQIAPALAPLSVAVNPLVNIHNNRRIRYTGAQPVCCSLLRGAHDPALCPAVPPSRGVSRHDWSHGCGV